LGPRGLSAKQFEAETGCKIIVRGRGSFRDKRKVIIQNHYFLIERNPLFRKKKIVVNQIMNI
jgi:hypothetical protein